MIKTEWSVEDVLRAVKGRYLHAQDWTATGLSIDSRTTEKGDIYIAIKGESLDGHDFAGAAIEAGAIAAIVSHQPPRVPADAPLIFVEDTLTALEDLGRAGRARASGRIIGVTGSVGKTSTKTMLALMLGAVGETFSNVGSLNNHWGVPLTLARMPAASRYNVIEVGMNHAGEMEALAKQIKPHIALITNVEAAHLEFFASTEAIADAKAEIFQSMEPSGIAVLNHDNPHFARLATAAKAQGIKKILSFGSDSKCDARFISVEPDENGTSVKASIMGKEITYRIGAAGAHLAINALGSLLVCAALDADVELCAQALQAYRTPERRGTREILTLPDGGSFTLIDETFNASPAATKAAINTLGTLSAKGAGRRIAVLGEMRELGESAPTLHADLADPLLKNKIDLVFCCAGDMKHLHNAIPPEMRGGFRETSGEMIDPVLAEIQDGDVVMVKGSKSVHMDDIAGALRAAQNTANKKQHPQTA